MTTIKTTTLDENGEPVYQDVDLQTNDGGFTCIVHQQGIKVEVPTFVEIDPQDTIRCMDEMSQAQWSWITGGPLFHMLWKEAFDPADRSEPPKNIDALNMGDLGLRHVAGMIVLGCEAFMAGKSVFVRNPETYLHPKTERYIMTMMKKMMETFQGTGGTVTAVDEAPEKIVKVRAYTKADGTEVPAHERKIKPKPQPEPEPDVEGDTANCLQWLDTLQAHYGEGKEVMSLGDRRLTVEEVATEIKHDTEVGRNFVEEFVKMRDGG